MRYAIIENGIVTNVVAWDGGEHWSPPQGSTTLPLKADSPVGMGWTHDGEGFNRPAPPPPRTTLMPSEFLALFTDEELDAIQDSTHTIARRSQRELYTRQEVDLAHELTQQLVGALQAIGLLTPERAVHILSGLPPE